MKIRITKSPENVNWGDLGPRCLYLNIEGAACSMPLDLDELEAFIASSHQEETHFVSEIDLPKSETQP